MKNIKTKFFCLLCVFFFNFSGLFGYDYYLAICTIFKDNAKYFPEWIEYHQMLGVEHFYLYDNESSDNSLEILQPYIDQGIVTFIPWPNIDKHLWGKKGKLWINTTQEAAYNHCISITQNIKWLAVIDTDEFILPIYDNSINNFLKKFENEVSVFLWWKVFGTSWIYDIPEDCLMIELLNLRFPDDHERNKQGKLIIQPKKALAFDWAGHRCKYKTAGKPANIPVDQMRINHYVNRTIKFLFEQKKRDKETMDYSTWTKKESTKCLCEGNDVKDSLINKFSRDLRIRLGMPEKMSDKNRIYFFE